MNKYDYLIKLLNDSLGQNYDVKYFENESPTWKEILVDNMIHGVLNVVGGDSQKMGGLVVDTQTYTISLMLPIEIKEFTDSLSHTEAVLQDLSNEVNQFGSQYVELAYVNRSDSQKTCVNGTDYALVQFVFNATYYDKAVLGNESEIKITLNNVATELTGVFNVTYQSVHQCDSIVLGTQNPISQNRLAGIQKTLTIDLVFSRDNSLHLDLMQNDGTNKQYQVKYDNGFITRTMNMCVLSITEYVPKGSIIKGQIVLGVKRV